MGSSDLAIEYHNQMMETDADYAVEYQQQFEEEAFQYQYIMAISDRYLNHFPDYRIDHKGYEEFDDSTLDVETVGKFEEDDLPW